MASPLYRCMTKGTDRASGPPSRGMHWATSRRGMLRIYSDRVELGDWTIPHAAVREAKAYRFMSLFGRGHVLELRTDERTYQFGLNPWAKPFEHLPYPVATEDTALGLSAASLALRLVLVALILADAARALEADAFARLAFDLALLLLVGTPLVVGLVTKLRRRR